MKTANNRLNIADLPDIFSPRELAQVMGIHQQGGYELVRQEGFPVVKVGKKYLIPKQAFLSWLNQKATV